jgi:hypothetical protein
MRSSVTDWPFKDLVQQGLFNPQNTVQRYKLSKNNEVYVFKLLFIYPRHALAYTYGRILEEALEAFRIRWNSHRIRPSRTVGCPAGVPDDLYSLPELTGNMITLWFMNVCIYTYTYNPYKCTYLYAAISIIT